MEMARRKRSSLPAGADRRQDLCLEDLAALLVEAAQRSGRFQSYPHAFAPRIFIRSGLWRILEAEDPQLIADLHNRGLLNQSTLLHRIDFMEHYSSAPSRPMTHVARFTRASTNSLSIHGFRTPEAMRSFIDLVTQEHPVKWVNDYCIVVPSLDDLTISSERLEEIMDTTQTIALHAPYPSIAAQIAGRQPDTQASLLPAPTTSKPRSSSQPVPEGSLSVAAIAELKSLDPAKVRRRLRKLNLKAPITPDQLNQI